MSSSCQDHCQSSAENQSHSPAYRRVLWIALIVNLGMFFVEVGSSLHSDSVSLMADAVDFLGDAASYALALMVMGMAAIWGSRVALFKAISMLCFGLLVLGRIAWSYQQGTVPEANVMGVVGGVALLANVAVAALLYAYRQGNANMRAVWLCTRNDAIGNLAVVLAALGVFGMGTAWPDLLVGLIMAGLALHSGRQIYLQARGELQGEQHVH
jgi:Co/Zn/Cd efflux system component